MKIVFILTYIAVFVSFFVPVSAQRPTDGLSRKTVVFIASKDNNVYKPLEAIKPVPLSCSDYYHTIIKYDWDPYIASAIMKAESNCNYADVGDRQPINGVLAPSCGLMQIRTLPGRPTCDQLFNADFNIQYAYQLYKAHGWTPWTMYNNGQYKNYLN